MTSRTLRRIGVLGLTALCLFPVPVAGAADAHPNKNTDSRGDLPPVHIPTVDHGPAREARQKLNQAESKRDRAQDALDDLVKRFQREFESSPAYRRAADDLRDAQAASDAATTPVMARLSAEPAYQAAQAAKREAQARVDALRKDPAAPAEQLTAAASAALDRATAVTQLESAALAADPACVAAQQRVVAAGRRLTQLKADHEATVRASPELKKVRDHLEDARRDVSAANDVVERAAAKERQQEAARRAALDEQARRDKVNAANDRNDPVKKDPKDKKKAN